jgi:hypothetical protein
MQPIRSAFSPPRFVFGMLFGLLLLLGPGCSWLTPLIFMGEHKERVPAEFDRLSGKTVAVVVWADQDVLFDYPFVRMELGLHIADRLWANVDNVEMVDGRKLEDYMQRRLANAVDPIVIGKEFAAEMIVYVELLDFQIRDPSSPDFLNPRIDASVVAYDLTVDPDEPRQYELEPVEVERRGKLFNETSAQVARKALYEEFAETVARKFYDHEIEMLQ